MKELNEIDPGKRLSASIKRHLHYQVGHMEVEYQLIF